MNSTYKYKLAMIDIGKEVGDNVMVGGCSFGFRLYNSTKPVLNVYMYQYHDRPELKKRVIKLFNSGKYCLMVPSKKSENDSIKAAPMEVNYLNELSKETGYSFELVHLYDIGDRNISLIKKQTKSVNLSTQ